MTEGLEPADVIGVQMREDDPVHGARIEPSCGELGGNLVLGTELEAGQPEVRVPALVISRGGRPSGLPGVEETQAEGVLHGERMHGKRRSRPATGQVPPGASTLLLPHAACR